MPVPTGTVKLQLDGVDIPGATATLDDVGNYTIIFAGLPSGADNITAVYSGDANFKPSTSPVLVQQVNQVQVQGDTVTSLSSDPNPSNFGDPVNFAGKVAAA